MRTSSIKTTAHIPNCSQQQLQILDLNFGLGFKREKERDSKNKRRWPPARGVAILAEMRIKLKSNQIGGDRLRERCVCARLYRYMYMYLNVERERGDGGEREKRVCMQRGNRCTKCMHDT